MDGPGPSDDEMPSDPFDPFDGYTFDDRFVAAAEYFEEPADERRFEQRRPFDRFTDPGVDGSPWRRPLRADHDDDPSARGGAPHDRRDTGAADAPPPRGQGPGRSGSARPWSGGLWSGGPPPNPQDLTDGHGPVTHDGHTDYWDYPTGTDDHRRGRNRWITIVAMIVIVALFAVYALSQLTAGFAMWDANRVTKALRGNEDPRPRSDQQSADPGDASPTVIRGKDWPPAPTVRRTTRVAPAPPIPAASGTHGFLAMQKDGSGPVAYDPCREIHYVTTGAANAPIEGADLIRSALARVSQLTGLVFVDDGPTDEAPSDTRPSYQPQRYGERWAPVLIAWSDPAASPRLAESGDGPDVLGYAGSSAAGFTTTRTPADTGTDDGHGAGGTTGGTNGSTSDAGDNATGSGKSRGTGPGGSSVGGAGGTNAGGAGSGDSSAGGAGRSDAGGAGRQVERNSGSRNEMVYVTGSVVLDGPDFASLYGAPGGAEMARGALFHELGHLLGLDHVDDPTQLMYPTLQPGMGDFAAGDIQGLSALGRGRCLPDL